MLWAELESIGRFLWR